eukprot:364197-Chlamydomonas_euryale.AAC.6
MASTSKPDRHICQLHDRGVPTGQPPCRARWLISPSRSTDQNSTASPLRGLYVNEPSSQLRQSVIKRSAPVHAREESCGEGMEMNF